MLNLFLSPFDWNSFWMNVLVSVIFLIISIPIAIKTIPYYTIKLIKAKNKKHIVRKMSSLIQEMCDFLDETVYKDGELNKEQLAIFTDKKDLKNHRFIGLLDMNVLNKIVRLKIFLVIVDHYKKLNPNESFELLSVEKDKLKRFRNLLENLIDIHALHIDDKVISEVSDLCLEIRSFEIRFKYNNAIDDLIQSGVTERTTVFGIGELAKIYQMIVEVLFYLIKHDGFETEIKEI